MTEKEVASFDSFKNILETGMNTRTLDKGNSEISRSHTIFRVSLERYANSTSKPSISFLNIVDLAGSKSSEGGIVNKSLLALSAVIAKLGEAKKSARFGQKNNTFIPYRDSKLTRLLKPSLGGNTYTVVLCVITPSKSARDDSVSTLKFGQLCKNIKNVIYAQQEEEDDDDYGILTKSNSNDSLAPPPPPNDFNKSQSTFKHALGDEFRKIVRLLESFILTKGISLYELNSVLNAPHDKSLVDILCYYINSLLDELGSSNLYLQELKNKLTQFESLETYKQSIDNYEQETRKNLNFEMRKVEEETQKLTVERNQLLRERTALNEKENRLNSLISGLDDKESKLRQLQGQMKDQHLQWQRSITDLQRREEVLSEWERSYKAQEKALKEREATIDKKLEDVYIKEGHLLSIEKENKNSLKLIAEKQIYIQNESSRLKNLESNLQTLSDDLKNLENNLKLRDNKCMILENEIANHKKELDAWDNLLKEKERKLMNEQKLLDDREAIFEKNDEKLKLNDKEYEKRNYELKNKENVLKENIEKYSKDLIELNKKFNEIDEKNQEILNFKSDLFKKQEELLNREAKLRDFEASHRDIYRKEQELIQLEETLKQREENFYQVELSNIMNQYQNDSIRLQDLVKKQFNLIQELQNSNDSLWIELSHHSSDYSLDNSLLQRGSYLNKLSHSIEEIESAFDQSQIIRTIRDVKTVTKSDNDPNSLPSTSTSFLDDVYKNQKSLSNNNILSKITPDLAAQIISIRNTIAYLLERKDIVSLEEKKVYQPILESSSPLNDEDIDGFSETQRQFFQDQLQNSLYSNKNLNLNTNDIYSDSEGLYSPSTSISPLATSRSLGTHFGSTSQINSPIQSPRPRTLSRPAILGKNIR